MNGIEQTEVMQKLSETLQETRARENREKYPITTDIVDQLREYWPELQVKHSEENGGIGKDRKTIFLGKGVYGCNIYLETDDNR